VHLRQGLLAMAHGQPVYEALTRRMLRRSGLMQADGVATEAGRAQAAQALRDETRWQALRRSGPLSELAVHDDGLTAIDRVLTADQLARLDAGIRPKGVPDGR
jgi:manganese/zinc/iron transport system permease protein